MTTTEAALSFPRQEAVTRRFRLGLPRGFRVSPDGSRVAFIRSAGGRDPVGNLWVGSVVDGSWTERCVVDARDLAQGAADLPEAEKARRERLRELTTGITAFAADTTMSLAAFSLDGVPYLVDLIADELEPRLLPHPGPVVDPQLSPDGQWVSYVADRALYVVPSSGHVDATLLCAPHGEHDSWGLADFIAAEELGRHRGLWWLPSGNRMLVEHVDESSVETRWISDPANPELEPRAHRYPSAGTANPTATLHVVNVDGTSAEVEWDHEAYPYLATVVCGDQRASIISVLSRDQQRQLILRLEANKTKPVIVKERRLAPWLTMHPGVPSLAADGSLLEIVANLEEDCFQLATDDRPLTPAGLNVDGLVDASTGGFLLTATDDPQQQHVFVLDVDGSLTCITEPLTVNAVAGHMHGMVVTTADGDSTTTRFLARLDGGEDAIPSLGEQPITQPRVGFHRVGERGLSAAVLWPTGHRPGTRLPVIMAPYGGPNSIDVLRSARAFASEQYLADQGFAVIVIDGRGMRGRGPRWEFAIQDDLASVALDDQVDGLAALAALYPDLDTTRVGITGWSFGGYLAALAVLDRPDVFHCAVAGAPVTDWRLYDTAYSERYLGLPQENAAAYDASSLLTRSSALSRPLLLIHGFADDNVLVAHTLQFSSALLVAGRPHSVLPLNGVSHYTPQEDVAENLLRLEVDFLRRHLAG